MKKTSKKLRLQSETLRPLDAPEQVVGGAGNIEAPTRRADIC